MMDCNHEEADTRIHILHALQQGMMTVKVCTVDTDVVVILAGALYDLSQTQPQLGRYLGCIWHKQELSVLRHYCNLC